MDDFEKQKLIYKKYIGNFSKKGQQFLFYCPFCKYSKHPKFSVNIDEQIFHCWVCDRSGTIFSLLKSKKATNDELKYFYRTHQLYEKNYDAIKSQNFTINLPNDYVNLLDSDDINTERVYKYAQKRGLNNYKIRYYNLGCSQIGQFNDYLLIPSYNSNGEVNYLQGRYILDDKKKKKHLNISKDKYGFTKNNIIPFELFVDWDNPIIFVEGFFDININFNCLPLLGSSLNENSPILLKLINSNCEKIYIMLDDDATFKAMKISQLLLSYGIQPYFCNIYPKYHEPSQINDKEFGCFIKNALKLNYNTISQISLETGE